MVVEQFVNVSPVAEKTIDPFPWLMVYFRQIYGQASQERAYHSELLHMAYSWNGLVWTPMNDNHPVYTPVLEGKPLFIRDPFVSRGPDGYFHLVCTHATHGWYSRSIFYARSLNLVDWEDARLIPVMEDVPGAKNAWAPEFMVDPASGDYFLTWTSTLAEKVSVGKHIWFTRTKDFHNFTLPQPLFDPGLNIIDAHLIPLKNSYYLFFKPDTHNETKFVRLAASNSLDGPYEIITDGITPAVSEGPQVMRPKNPSSLYLYYDMAYTNRYGLSVSKDLCHWQEMGSTRFPDDARHASFLSVTEDELANILWRHDFRFLAERNTLEL